jgi:hypothetical protein
MTLPDPRGGESRELRGDALDRPARLGVGVEQVARDEEEVELLVDREVDGGLERGELALALGRRGVAEVGMTSAEMDVRGMEQSEHPGAIGLLSRRRARSDEARWEPVAERPLSGPVLARARRPLALARHPESRRSL